MQPRCHLRLQRLDSGSPVHMRDCLKPGPPFWPNGNYARHETCKASAGWRYVEIARCRVNGHNRCEWPKRLAIFDFAVQPVARFGRVRRREDAAVAKCTRAELESAIHPSDDAISRQVR